MQSSLEHSVLFVCFGNICRSPMAEAIFKKLLSERSLSKSWHVDSAGVSPWYIGHEPDPRAIKVINSRNYHTNHKARQVDDTDFRLFEYIMAMDDENLFDLVRMAPPGSSKAKLELLGTYDPAGNTIIDDPYYTKGDKAFYIILDHCKRSCEAFLKKILRSEKSEKL